MKERFLKCLAVFILLSGPIIAQPSDQTIQNVISEINQDSVTYYIQSLQNFGSRFEYKENRKEVAEWLMNEFIGMGYEEVELDSFMCETGYGNFGAVMQYNVVATLSGTDNPDAIYIIGGHYDSYNSYDDPMSYAPGADDNASGTSAALETARAIAEAGYKPESTIKFVCFAAEELMLSGNSGSEYMAEQYRLNNVDLKLMINNDMIANNQRPLDESMVSVNYYTGSETLKDVAMNLMDQYSAVTPMEGGLNVWTDSRSFYEEGFPAIYYDEYDFSPNYHSSDDVIANCDLEYCTEVIKGSAAMLIYSVESPSPVHNLNAFDVGDGATLKFTWAPNTDSDFNEYKLYSGLSADSLEYVISTEDTTYNLTGLLEGVEYYFGVSSTDVDGNETLITSTSAVPNNLPKAPAGVQANPAWYQIELSWFPNDELDLIGYEVNKSKLDSNGDKLTSTSFFVEDTSFTDEDCESGVWYLYEVAAMDADSNLSIDNTKIESRVISLDKGVLFVNQTTGRDGSPGNPTIQEVNDFYNSLAEGSFEADYVNIDETNKVNMAHLGAHQLIVWHVDHSDDVNQTEYSEYIDLIGEYLLEGGNLLFTGYRPVRAFSYEFGNVNEFSPYVFISGYLNISASFYAPFTLFNEAVTEELGFPTLEIDSAKVAGNDGHLKNIESIVPTEKGITIYSYGSNYDINSLQGSMAGRSVGVVFQSSIYDYSSIVLSFPLYYTKQEQAKQFLRYALKNVFDVPTGIKDYPQEEKIVNDFQLSQNYPNPFNPTTSIEYQVASSGLVSLKVYDVLGREVKKLVNEVKTPGSYSVTFDASNLSSGIYFYTITSGSFTQTRKMILMK